jgi:polyisoprenoid-binding protein YceI
MEFKTRSAFLIASAAAVVIISLGGCPTGPKRSESPPAAVGVSPPGSLKAPGHEGRPYDVDSRESLLTILAFRGGALAKAGHNHVIASHDMTGTFYVPDDVLHSTFELHVPVAQLAIDEPELRSKEGSEFPTEVPDSAKEGTRRNMLSEALLNGAQYPEITLVSQHLEGATNAAALHADVQVTVRGQSHSVSVPVTYTLVNDELVASGELPIKQSDLGLTPFSAMLGALQVQDELRVRFRVVARRAQIRGS